MGYVLMALPAVRNQGGSAVLFYLAAYAFMDLGAFGTLATLSEEKKDLDDLQMFSTYLYEMSNCGLGQTAGSPLKDILNYFRSEVEAHIKLKVCPTGVCRMSGHTAVN